MAPLVRRTEIGSTRIKPSAADRLTFELRALRAAGRLDDMAAAGNHGPLRCANVFIHAAKQGANQLRLLRALEHKPQAAAAPPSARAKRVVSIVSIAAKRGNRRARARKRVNAFIHTVPKLKTNISMRTRRLKHI